MGMICDHDQNQKQPGLIEIEVGKRKNDAQKAEFNTQIKSSYGKKPQPSFAKQTQRHYPLTQEASKIFHRIVNKDLLQPFEDQQIYEVIGKGVTYQGQFADFLPDGYGICYFEKGQVYVGNFRKGKMESDRGYYICFDGSYYIGRLKNSSFEGYGILSYGNKSLEYSGQWKNGVPEGYGVQVYLNGSKYEGMLKNGKWQGSGRYQWETSVVYNGDFKGGQLSGHGYLHSKDGELIYIGNFDKNKKNGKGILKTSKGIYEGDFIDDSLTGSGIFVWNNKTKAYIGEFKESKMNGEGRMLYSTGMEVYGEWLGNHNFKITKQNYSQNAEKQVKELVERFERRFQMEKEESSKIDEQLEQMNRKVFDWSKKTAVP